MRGHGRTDLLPIVRVCFRGKTRTVRSIPCAQGPSSALYLGGMPTTPMDTGARSAEEQVDAYLARFGPERQQLIRAVRKVMQARFPTANELVYDYARNFVIGYSPTLAGGEGLVAISADAEGVRLYLTQGLACPTRMRCCMARPVPATCRWRPLKSWSGRRWRPC